MWNDVTSESSFINFVNKSKKSFDDQRDLYKSILKWTDWDL